MVIVEDFKIDSSGCSLNVSKRKPHDFFGNRGVRKLLVTGNGLGPVLFLPLESLVHEMLERSGDFRLGKGDNLVNDAAGRLLSDTRLFHDRFDQFIHGQFPFRFSISLVLSRQLQNLPEVAGVKCLLAGLHQPLCPLHEHEDRLGLGFFFFAGLLPDA